MSLVNRDQIRRLILKEFKMLGMADLGHGGMKPMGFSSQSHDTHNDAAGHDSQAMLSVNMPAKNNVSREDCCAAVMCLIECCSCPVTKQALIECCQDILSGQHDR